VWATTFTILTTAANALIASYHDRMPVILADRDADDWMDPRAPNPLVLKRLLVPAPADLLIATPVSPEVNNVDSDSPDLLEPAGQMSLSLRSGQPRVLN
jgi:putative SOS response-associated peptidase YedK